MKFLYYCLAAVFLIVFGLGAFLAPAPKNAARHETTARREVYVDAAELVRLHPGSSALSEMAAVLAESRVDRVGTAAPERLSEPLPAATGALKSSTSRADVEAEAAQAVVRSLSRLESDQQQALQARLQASRALRMESAKSEINVKVQEINQSRDAAERTVSQRFAPDQLNARLKQSGLQAAIKATERPGIDEGMPSVIEQELTTANSSLNDINDAAAAQQLRVEEEAKKQIDALEAASMSKIDADLLAYEISERKSINDGVIAARNQTLRELASFETATSRGSGNAYSPMPKLSAAVAADDTVQKANTRDIVAMKQTVDVLQTRIRGDIIRAVRKLAHEKNLRVTFSRQTAGVPDETQAFADELRDHAWNVCGPILYEGHGG